jgi:ADP-L-glycero-D-manno-heptose 6-epimerase
VIVVTGAAGFIGSNIVADIEARGLGPVAAVDWFGTGEKWRNLAKRRLAHVVLPEQLPDFLDAHDAEVSALIHMGAISATTETDVDRLVERNVNATVALWDWCAANEKPFVYASSAATYGGREGAFTDDDRPGALAALEPLNAYGWSKKVVDLMFAERAVAGKPAPPLWVGVKFFNVYGPNEAHKGDMRSVAKKMFEDVTAGRTVRLFRSHKPGVADGEQRRDFVYVKDASAFVLDALGKAPPSGVYNCGSGRARSFLDIVAALRRATNRAIEVEFVDTPEPIRDKYQYFTEADMTKARAAGLGTEPTSLEAGVEDYVSTYLARSDPYR